MDTDDQSQAKSVDLLALSAYPKPKYYKKLINQ